MPFTLLDGGMGHLLKERAQRGLQHGLASSKLFMAAARANTEDPGIVLDLHREYIAAGADVITTNNFVITPHALSETGDSARLHEWTAAAGRLAREAASGTECRVAGCLPPLIDSYKCDGLPCHADMVAAYASIASSLAPHVDVMLCETLSSIAEAKAACEAAMRTAKPIWVSFTLDDCSSCRLRSGEALEEAVHAVTHVIGLQAIMVNCCAPLAVSAALPTLVACRPDGVSVGAYPNGFRQTTSEWLTRGVGRPPSEFGSQPSWMFDDDGLIKPTALAETCESWLLHGADILGGCCGIGPAHINALAKLRRKA